MKRWPIIRSFRYAYNMWMFTRWWNRFGSKHYLTPNPMDLEYLEDIRTGRA